MQYINTSHKINSTTMALILTPSPSPSRGKSILHLTTLSIIFIPLIDFAYFLQDIISVDSVNIEETNEADESEI